MKNLILLHWQRWSKNSGSTYLIIYVSRSFRTDGICIIRKVFKRINQIFHKIEIIIIVLQFLIAVNRLLNNVPVGPIPLSKIFKVF